MSHYAQNKKQNVHSFKASNESRLNATTHAYPPLEVRSSTQDTL